MSVEILQSIPSQIAAAAIARINFEKNRTICEMKFTNTDKKYKQKYKILQSIPSQIAAAAIARINLKNL